MKPEILKEHEEQNEADLKEIAHFYGGWKELRKLIDRLEDNDNEADFERQQNDFNATSEAERQEMQYRCQRDIK